jgi:c-di-GMP-binding flagellar brake protein YcgR
VVGERPLRSTAVDISERGMAVWRVSPPRVTRGEVVAVELALPGTGETIWAEATTLSEDFQRGVQRAGLQFVAMARRHEAMLRDFLMDRRLRALEPRPPWRFRDWARRALAIQLDAAPARASLRTVTPPDRSLR